MPRKQISLSKLLMEKWNLTKRPEMEYFCYCDKKDEKCFKNTFCNLYTSNFCYYKICWLAIMDWASWYFDLWVSNVLAPEAALVCVSGNWFSILRFHLCLLSSKNSICFGLRRAQWRLTWDWQWDIEARTLCFNAALNLAPDTKLSHCAKKWKKKPCTRTHIHQQLTCCSRLSMRQQRTAITHTFDPRSAFYNGHLIQSSCDYKRRKFCTFLHLVMSVVLFLDSIRMIQVGECHIELKYLCPN